MIPFPQNPFKRAAAANPLAALRSSRPRDILWNRPLFRAPALASPPAAIEPLPFQAVRVTRPARD